VGKHHQQGLFLSQGKRFTLVELFIVSGQSEELLKFKPQTVSLLLMGILPIVQELAV
jgi:hypothetical protein